MGACPAEANSAAEARDALSQSTGVIEPDEFIVLGAIIDELAMILLTIPIIYPVIPKPGMMK